MTTEHAEDYLETGVEQHVVATGHEEGGDREPPDLVIQPDQHVGNGDGESRHHLVIDLREAETPAIRLPEDQQVIQFPVASRRIGPYERFFKPVIDFVGGLALALLLLPLITVIALAVFLTLGRPVLYKQVRVGRGGRYFNMYKFRTMHPDRRRGRLPITGQDRRRVHKSPDDPRHTRLGRALRRWSLDELPQFWNVLKGDMSLVGPRPELAEIVERYDPWQHQRHQVKPGITGLWQVTTRSEGRLMFEDTGDDIAYLDMLSLRTDVRILWKTIPTMLGSRTGF